MWVEQEYASWYMPFGSRRGSVGHNPEPQSQIHKYLGPGPVGWYYTPVRNGSTPPPHPSPLNPPPGHPALFCSGFRVTPMAPKDWRRIS